MAFSAVIIINPTSIGAEHTTQDKLSPQAQQQYFINSMVTQFGFDAQQLTELFQEVTINHHILSLLEQPSTRQPYHVFRQHFVNRQRIENGVAFWQRYQQLITQISQYYTIEPQYLVAILGIESAYGKILGQYRVLDALATIAFYSPQRADYFREELSEFLLLAREEQEHPGHFKGSYAGAMGMAQFMPSSFRRYAIDWDNDQRRDIWSNPADTLASIANYLKQYGWQHQQPLLAPVEHWPAQALDLADKTFRHAHTVEQLQHLGIHSSMPLEPNLRAVIVALDTKPGKSSVWLGLNNFYVITRYNKSSAYAMAVYELANAIQVSYQQKLQP